MISTFYHGESGQSLGILDYDQSRTNNVRYRAVINEDTVAVLQLQSVDVGNIPVSLLSLCPGIQESEFHQFLSDTIDKTDLGQFFIERVDDKILYR